MFVYLQTKEFYIIRFFNTFIAKHKIAASTQLYNLVLQFFENSAKIDKPPLPIDAKIQAGNTIFMSKLDFYLQNLHVPEKILDDMEKELVQNDRHLFSLNTSSSERLCSFPDVKEDLVL